MNDETSNDERTDHDTTEEVLDPELVRLREDIAETRSDMSATISALEERLDPSEVKQKIGEELQHVEDRVRVVVREQMDDAEQKIKKGLAEARDTVKSDIKEAVSGAKRAVRAATLGKVEDLATDIGDKMNDTRDTLVNTIRSNPIPAAMVGVGLAWLLMNRSNSASRRRSGEYEDGDPSLIEERAMTEGQNMKDAMRQRVRGASEAAGNALHGASDAVTGLTHRATDAASHLVDQAGDAATSVAHGARRAATSVAGGARRGAQRMEQGFQHTLHENPVAVGAAALALGAVVGYSLPRTDREDALLGPARDRVLHRASDAAHDAADAVAHLAEKTGEKATASLQKSAST